MHSGVSNSAGWFHHLSANNVIFTQFWTSEHPIACTHVIHCGLNRSICAKLLYFMLMQCITFMFELAVDRHAHVTDFSFGVEIIRFIYLLDQQPLKAMLIANIHNLSFDNNNCKFTCKLLSALICHSKRWCFREFETTKGAFEYRYMQKCSRLFTRSAPKGFHLRSVGLSNVNASSFPPNKKVRLSAATERWCAKANSTISINIILTPNCDYCHLVNCALHNALAQTARQKLINELWLNCCCVNRQF